MGAAGAHAGPKTTDIGAHRYRADEESTGRMSGVYTRPNHYRHRPQTLPASARLWTQGAPRGTPDRARPESREAGPTVDPKTRYDAKAAGEQAPYGRNRPPYPRRRSCSRTNTRQVGDHAKQGVGAG